jgi:hypothetical protein
MIPISDATAGMFFTCRGGGLYFVTRLKTGGKPEISEMLYTECRWLPPQTAYGVRGAAFRGPADLVKPLTRDEVLKWNRDRFVLETQALVKKGDRHVLRRLKTKALAPTTRQLRERGVSEVSARSELYRALCAGPDNVQQVAIRLVAAHAEAEQVESTVQALLANLDKAVQVEALDVELCNLEHLFVSAREHFEIAVARGDSEEIQIIMERSLQWVRKQVATARKKKTT